MSRKKHGTVELRFYEVPQGEPVLALLGESWVRVYGQDVFSQHFHNLMEIGYCRDGAGSVFYETRELHYETSALSIVPANYPHSTLSEGTKPNYWEFLFFDPAAVIANMYADNPVMQRRMTDCINARALLLHENENPALVSLVCMVMEEMRACRPNYRESVRGLLCALCVEILRMNDACKNLTAEVETKHSMQIAPAFAYIMENYAAPVRAQELADVCGMSETHFRRLFEAYANMPPIDYLNLVRVQHACELLKKTSDSMDIVAAKVGFSTTSTFNRNFKKFLGSSPYQWKINPGNYECKLLNYNISALKGW